METKYTPPNKLKQKIIPHLYLFGFSLAAAIIFGSLNNNKFDIYVFLLFVIYFQIEFFMWLGRKLFSKPLGLTPGEITRKTIFRYIQFHLLCFVGAAIVFLIMMAIWYLKDGKALSNLIPNIIQFELKGWLIATNIGLFFGALMFFLTQWQDELKKAHKLREEKLSFKYETLNNQVNPHFLFNSLNTLSSFIKTDPDVAEEYVNKMASIYRYITDNVSKNQVNLNDEIAFIKDYFYLHKLRDNDKIELEINIPETNNYKIIPVSLQLLIENALKHNMATKKSPLHISVILDNNNKIIVSNNLQRKNTLETSLKKGLNNLKDRVSLSTGKEVEIIESNTDYIVKIPLS